MWTGPSQATILLPRQSLDIESMNRFIVVLTAAMTLSHTVVGCCAHAGHGSDCREETHVVRSGHHQHDSTHDAEKYGPVDQRGPGHSDETCCGKCKCKWLSPDALSDLSVELLWYSTIFDEDQIIRSDRSHSLLSVDFPADSLFALPVRPHLALSILLI